MNSTGKEMVRELKKKALREKWLKDYEEQKASGLGVREWCRQKGINPSTYFKRVEKMRHEYCENLTEDVQRDIIAGHDIVPVVTYQREVSKEFPIVIKTGEISVELPSGSSSEVIASVIRALKSC